MKNKIILLLIIASLNPAAEAMIAPTAPAVPDPVIAELITKTNEFTDAGYIESSDVTARGITQKLLNPSATKFATPLEREAIVDVHLRTELYYAFNTQWGTGKQRNHRIVYDFLSQLNKSGRSRSEHITIVTVLSLAAQEYFWNEKSTVDDLKRHVKRELRYGLFKQAEHNLNVSNIIYLDGERQQDSVLNRVIDTWITGSLRGKLAGLMNGFKAKTLGNIYRQIAGDLEDKFRGPLTSLPFGNLGGGILGTYGLGEQMALRPMASAPDNMCGFHSLFIPTDGLVSAISEGNGRDKILQAIKDNVDDEEARRLYLHASRHMDAKDFTKLMNKHIMDLRAHGNEAQAIALQGKLTTYQNMEKKLQADKEAINKEVLGEIIKKPGLTKALEHFNALLNNSANLSELPKRKGFNDIIDKIVFVGTRTEGAGNDELKRRFSAIEKALALLDHNEKYELMIETLKDFIGPDMLPGKSDNAFSVDAICKDGLSYFVTNICQAICTFLSENTDDNYDETASEIEALWTIACGEKNEIAARAHKELSLKRLEIAESLRILHIYPEEFSPQSLIDNMIDIAMNEENELNDYLRCNTYYTQLWAILNNLNVFVFSMGQEANGRPPLELITRLKDKRFDDIVTDTYLSTQDGWTLAPVILTSPTAKNVFIDKRSSIHYEKFIEPGDFAAMAKAQRHLEWMKLPTKYAAYP